MKVSRNRCAQAADHKDPFCPSCGCGTSTVSDSRAHSGIRYRRRVCKACKFKFTTAEHVIDVSMYDAIIKGLKFSAVDD